ncbi:MAG: OmpA family protein, partial [Flavobacteriales bacterium]
MKKFYKLLLIGLFIFGTTSIQAQDENNPWQVSFGMNAVDQDADTSTQIADFFAVEDNWNISSPFSMFSVSRYIGNNLSFGVGASMNSITKYADA